MFGTDRRAAKAAWTVFLVVLTISLVYLIRETLLLFTIAILFAYLLSPVVNWVERLSARRGSRIVALLTVYVLLVGVLAVAGAALGSRIAEQAANLVNGLPAYLEKMQASLEQPGPAWFEPVRPHIQAALAERLEALGGEVVPLVQQIVERVLALAGNLFVIVLVPILGFFFLKDGGQMRKSIVDRVASPEKRLIVDDILNDVHHLLGQFMRALVILSIATFVAYGLFFALIGLRYSLLLAFVAAILEFIPVLGPLTATVIIVVVAALGGGGKILLILAFLGAYRLFQDYVLSPHLMSSGVELHPLLVIFGVLAGEQIGGVAGMFLSIPVLATLRVVYVRMQKPMKTAVSPT